MGPAHSVFGAARGDHHRPFAGRISSGHADPETEVAPGHQAYLG